MLPPTLVNTSSPQASRATSDTPGCRLQVATAMIAPTIQTRAMGTTGRNNGRKLGQGVMSQLLWEKGV
jgi:hypothetical protein